MTALIQFSWSKFLISQILCAVWRNGYGAIHVPQYLRIKVWSQHVIDILVTEYFKIRSQF